jgi:hypothetical protein
MIETALPSLAGWESFYVIIGSAAAALTGLQFVVIALGADKGLGGHAEFQAFATPTVVHFCAVVLLAAVATTPEHSAASLSLCLGTIGTAGLVYVGVVALRTRRQQGYAPVLSDWLWHTILPALAYATLVGAAIDARHDAAHALYAVGAAALLLLFIGIHNSWDAAVWMAVKRKQP